MKTGMPVSLFLNKERKRQEETVDLIPSENIASRALCGTMSTKSCLRKYRKCAIIKT